MNNKKWVIRLLTSIASLHIFLLISLLFIDPYQLFQMNPSRHKFEYTTFYSQVQYLALKKQKYSLVFGTSRSQKISTRYQKENILNFHNIYGIPRNVKNFLFQLNDEQIKNINNMYYLIDMHTLRDPEKNSNINYNKSNILGKLKKVFPVNSNHLLHLAKEIIYNTFPKKMYYFIDKDGSLFVKNKDQSTIVNSRPSKHIFKNSSYSKAAIQDIIDINEFCKQRKVNITFYTPTYTDKAIRELNLDTFQRVWNDLLLGGISFKSVYSIDGVSEGNDDGTYTNFTDATHLNYNAMNYIFSKYIKEDLGNNIEKPEELNELIDKLKSI